MLGVRQGAFLRLFQLYARSSSEAASGGYVRDEVSPSCWDACSPVYTRFGIVKPIEVAEPVLDRGKRDYPFKLPGADVVNGKKEDV
ncbi:hypothetical protein DPMN_015763 [Dreissena polymorpha]|uniref:Uncharacterized protein n=1 Tax=Dreissena polymorpha TaxID=45954 RepID=A0A9D4S5V7_DREPO|nr:hypothetical protein DPMN_015763 [Dreissena polymorpha]